MVASRGVFRPMAWPGRYPSLGTRRAVQYSKGALFMAHLRATLGDAAFWSGLRRYTRKHASGTVTSVDLVRQGTRHRISRLGRLSCWTDVRTVPNGTHRRVPADSWREVKGWTRRSRNAFGR